MTKPSIRRPPRLFPERPFPPYAYLPGRGPHPTRDPEGHSHGVAHPVPEPPNPEDWRASADYLYGIDLFNHGFYWEAHEAWEGLWVACGRRGTTADFLQALINLAAAGFKARWGSLAGMRANAKTARRLFDSVARALSPAEPLYMGLDVQALADHATALSRAAALPEPGPGGETGTGLDLALEPE